MKRSKETVQYVKRCRTLARCKECNAYSHTIYVHKKHKLYGQCSKCFRCKLANGSFGKSKFRNLAGNQIGAE